MKRVQKITSLGLLALPIVSCTNSEKVNETPNVIFILADDLGYGDLGCYGQQIIKTPNIDNMAKEGMQFMQHYAGCTVSAPSRCALMTGKNTGHTFVRGNMGVKAQDGRTYDTALPSSEVTLAELFKQKNYATACIGKWGLGAPNTEGHPNNQGFDYFFGYLGQAHAHSYFPKFIHENSTEITLDGEQYSHDLVEQKAIKYITENKDNPFFLYLTFTLPHAELKLPEKYMESHVGKYPEKPFISNGGSYSTQMTPHAAFASMVERLDSSVGTINSLLKELGIDENTIVIFSSDNGAHAEGGADPEFFNSTGIYRGIKRDMYEGGLRTPMIAKWPNSIAKGSKNSEPSAFWDFMPTFAEIINVDCPKESDGVSILRAFNGKEAKVKDRSFYWEFHEQGGKQAVLQNNWKLIRLQAKNGDKMYYELYNISTDPSEKNNLYETETEKAAELMEILDNSRTESEIFKM